MKILTLASIFLLGVSAVPVAASSYTVKKGDTVYRIARAHGLSAQSLMKLNGIGSSGVIVPGQKLKVNGTTSRSSAGSKISKASSTSSSYRVVKGDTLYGIARKHGISASKLKALNPSVNPNRISIGTKLKTSGTVSSSKPASKPKVAAKAPKKSTVTRTSSKPASKPVSKPKSKAVASSAPKPKAPSIAKQPAPVNRNPLPASRPASSSAPLMSAPPVSGPETAPMDQNPFIHPDIDLEYTSPSGSTVSAPLQEQAPLEPDTISSITVDKEVTYSSFAAQHGATTSQLNELNGLSLKSNTMLAKGSELYVPSSF